MSQSHTIHLKFGLKESLRFDFPASLVVFLVALPLCLGIALASGAPLFSGIVAGVVGGIVIGFFSGSEISVSGPAAGLAVIVAGAITRLGSFEAFLAAVVIAGVLQVAFGFLKAGIVGNYFPSSVIEGMLAAIGIVIVLKQIPHAAGWDFQYEGDLSFQSREYNTFTALIKALRLLNPIAFGIATLSLGVLIGWESKWIKSKPLLSLFPASLLVVFLGILINEAALTLLPEYALSQSRGQLVALPLIHTFDDFISKFTHPDPASFLKQDVWIVAITIALVASLETLLSIEAADKLDPYKRISDTHRELKAQGLGNVISGLLGGLPITAVIVRTSANVYAGARTRYSAIIHGILLFGCVIGGAALLNKIPLASLAAILIVVGYRLAKLSLFTEMLRSGKEVFIPFLSTVVAVVFTDLLIGIAIGTVVGLFFVLKANHHASVVVVNQDDLYLLKFNKDMSFVNKAELKEAFKTLPNDITLCIDGSKAVFIDNDIYDVINDFKASAKFRGITVEEKNLHSKHMPLVSITTPVEERLEGKPEAGSVENSTQTQTNNGELQKTIIGQ